MFSADFFKDSYDRVSAGIRDFHENWTILFNAGFLSEFWFLRPFLRRPFLRRALINAR